MMIARLHFEFKRLTILDFANLSAVHKDRAVAKFTVPAIGP
jgi:hypothetical protein